MKKNFLKVSLIISMVLTLTSCESNGDDSGMNLIVAILVWLAFMKSWLKGGR